MSLRIDLHVYMHNVPEPNAKLDQILKEVQKMAQELVDLQDAVASSRTVTESAITLINGLADKIDAVITDPAALAALTAELRDQASDLSEAVATNPVP